MRIGIQQLRQVCRYSYRCFIKVSLLYLQYKIHKKIRRTYIYRAILKRIMRNYVKKYLHVCLYTIKHPVDAEQPTPSKSKSMQRHAAAPRPSCDMIVAAPTPAQRFSCYIRSKSNIASHPSSSYEHKIYVYIKYYIKTFSFYIFYTKANYIRRLFALLGSHGRF